MRNPVEEANRAREAAEKERKAALDRAADLALAVLRSDDGRELFEYLARRVHLRGRSFLSPNAITPACPYAAASRDGEKAAIMHVYDLARMKDADIPIP